MLAQGRDLRAIARELKLARNTVRRFARASDPEELLVHNGTGKRPKMIEEYAGYLRQRWAQGCTNAEQLYQDVTAMGYRGKVTMVRPLVRPWRSRTTIALPPPSPPTVRQAIGWFLRHPDALESDEQQHLQTLTALCPALAALRERVRAFAQMMVQPTGEGLEQWMKRVQADDLPELYSFVTGLQRDFDAAKAGLTLPHGSAGRTRPQANTGSRRAVSNTAIRPLSAAVDTLLAMGTSPVYWLQPLFAGRVPGQLHPCLDAGGLHDVGDPSLDGSLADAQLAGDGLVRHARDQQGEEEKVV